MVEVPIPADREAAGDEAFDQEPSVLRDVERSRGHRRWIRLREQAPEQSPRIVALRTFDSLMALDGVQDVFQRRVGNQPAPVNNRRAD